MKMEVSLPTMDTAVCLYTTRYKRGICFMLNPLSTQFQSWHKHRDMRADRKANQIVVTCYVITTKIMTQQTVPKHLNYTLIIVNPLTAMKK